MPRIKLLTALAVATLVVSATGYAAVNFFAHARGKDLRGVTHININRDIQNSILLSNFDLEFSNGDHKIAEIGFLPANNHVKVALRDGNGDDPYDFEVSYYKAKTNWGARVQAASKKGCQGKCTLNIPKPKSPIMRFALLGFWFKRHGGDANVKQLAIRPRISEGQIDVVYKDNGTFKYDVEIRYIEYSKGFTTHVGTRTRSSSKGQQWTTVPTGKKGLVVIEGFDVRFTDSDHHLRHFGIKSGSNEVMVAFHDKNYDDPYTATIDYSVITSDLFK